MPMLETLDAAKLSMRDLASIHAGTYLEPQTAAVRELTEHVLRCPLCREKGSVCEICRDPRTIYPFQTGAVVACAGPCALCAAVPPRC
jgi:pleckstrin homology domain-containing family M member 1